MPVLPLIDALIFAGWSSMIFSFVMKAIAISNRYKPSNLGLTAVDFLTVSMVCMIFAVALAARSWVKANEHRILRSSRLQRPRELSPAEASTEAAGSEDSAGRQRVAAGR